MSMPAPNALALNACPAVAVGCGRKDTHEWGGAPMAPAPQIRFIFEAAVVTPDIDIEPSNNGRRQAANGTV